MCNNLLKVNEEKMEMIIIGPQAMREKVKSGLSSLITQTKPHDINLGVIVDCDLNFKVNN